MALKRALRNRSVSVDHSLSYRGPEDKLIPMKLWQHDRGRLIRDLNLPASSEKYLQRLKAGLSAGLAAFAEAVEADTVALFDEEPRSREPDAVFWTLTITQAEPSVGNPALLACYMLAITDSRPLLTI
jgi:hypothetical protein